MSRGNAPLYQSYESPPPDWRDPLCALTVTEVPACTRCSGPYLGMATGPPCTAIYAIITPYGAHFVPPNRSFPLIFIPKCHQL